VCLLLLVLHVRTAGTNAGTVTGTIVTVAVVFTEDSHSMGEPEQVYQLEQ